MRTCTVCAHPKRTEIELSVTNGASYRHISSQFAVGYKSVERHMDSHIKQAAKEQIRQRDEAKTLDVLKQLLDINTAARKILDQADRDGEHMVALYAMDRIMKQLELQAKLLGDLDERPQVNVWLPAPWEDIELAIAQALRPFPEAAIAVSEAIGRLEAGNARLN